MTPNPCMRCNGVVPLRGARRRSRGATGAAVLWTGHYARIRAERERPPARFATRRRPRQGRVLHAGHRRPRPPRARSPSRSATTTKAEVRAEAEAAAGMDGAPSRPESQEACFLAGRGLPRRSSHATASRTSSGADRRPESGAVVGRHDGVVAAHPPGQRRGLRRRHRPSPLYALRSDAGRERARRRAAAALLGIRLASRHAGDSTFRSPTTSTAKLRYRSPPTGARVRRPHEDGFALELAEPVEAVARRVRSPCSTTAASVVGAGVIAARDGVGSRAMTVAFSAG